jgi:hypothetical protein
MKVSRFVGPLAALFTIAAVACTNETMPPPGGEGTGAIYPPAATGTGTPPPAGQPTAPVPAPTDSPPAGTPPANTGWGPAKCSALPAGISSGFATGQQLPKLTVKDCDGNDYSLDNFCGADGTWVFIAHGWCGICQSVSSNSETLLAGYAGKNVAAVNILVQNASSQPPTATDCKAWRDTFKLKNVIALYDPTGVTLGIASEFGTTSAISGFLDKDRVIRSKIHHNGDQTLIKAGIDQSLTPR